MIEDPTDWQRLMLGPIGTHRATKRSQARTRDAVERLGVVSEPLGLIAGSRQKKPMLQLGFRVNFVYPNEDLFLRLTGDP